MNTSPKTLKMPLTLIGEGYGSRVYVTPNNIILRAAKNRITQQRHQQERQLLEFITPYIKSLTIPRPIILMGPTYEFPFGAIGYEKIDGVPLAPKLITSQNKDVIASQIAVFIDEIHEIETELVEHSFTLPIFPPSTDELQGTWNIVKTYVQNVLTQNQFDRANLWFQYIEYELSTTKFKPVLLHGDFWYENMIFNDDKLVGIIDFENMMVGHPIQDFLTQEYISTDFRSLVVSLYQKLNQGFLYVPKLANALLGIREIEGLAYGIRTNNIDNDQIEKIVRILHL